MLSFRTKTIYKLHILACVASLETNVAKKTVEWLTVTAYQQKRNWDSCVVWLAYAYTRNRWYYKTYNDDLSVPELQHTWYACYIKFLPKDYTVNCRTVNYFFTNLVEIVEYRFVNLILNRLFPKHCEAKFFQSIYLRWMIEYKFCKCYFKKSAMPTHIM